jgi:SpoVK/Ycf46/Vps4 family AAA+-type ATPase
MGSDGLFGDAQEFPDDDARGRFDALVGIDTIKGNLAAEAHVLLDPAVAEHWSTSHHHKVIPAVQDLAGRTALIILAGDVGTGKTELAESIGDRIARDVGVKVTLYPLSLSARGHGAVGEMTTLLTAAFDKVREHATGGRGHDGRLRHATILLVDEADALAQSRELAQMHHEDRAGVNALIRGVDTLRRDRLPVLTMMCTNRVENIDPAVRRRAAAIFTFGRPDAASRRELIYRSFDGVGVSDADLDEIVRLTGPQGDRAYGSTYSDLRQRFVPGVILDAFRANVRVTGERALELAEDFVPTRPFENEH